MCDVIILTAIVAIAAHSKRSTRYTQTGLDFSYNSYSNSISSTCTYISTNICSKKLTFWELTFWEVDIWELIFWELTFWELKFWEYLSVSALQHFPLALLYFWNMTPAVAFTRGRRSLWSNVSSWYSRALTGWYFFNLWFFLGILGYWDSITFLGRFPNVQEISWYLNNAYSC